MVSNFLCDMVDCFALIDQNFLHAVVKHSDLKGSVLFLVNQMLLKDD